MATHSGAPYGEAAVAARPRRNGLGVAALIIGVIALVLFWVWIIALPLAVVAIVLGAVGRNRVKRGTATKKGAATAGVVLGVLALLVAGALAAFGIAVFNSDSGKDYQSCLDKAHTSQQRDQCARDFGHRITH